MIYKKVFFFPEKYQFMELLVVLSILVSINLYGFSDNPGFINTCPHPFWIIILPFSARYGFSAGLYAAFLAGLTYLCMIKLYISNVNYYDLIQPEYIKLPLWFLLIGMIIGEIREIQKNKYTKLQVKNSDIELKLNHLSKQFDILNKAKEELDTHIISQEQTLSSLYESAQSLKSLDEKDIYPSVLEMLKEHVHVEACSIYILSEKKLFLEAYLNHTEKMLRPDKIETPEGLMAQALEQHKTLSINTLISSDQFGSFTDAVISSPIFDSSKKILGVINIEKIPFIKFTPQAVNLSRLISEWCGLALETARSYTQTKEKNISDDLTGAYNYKYFKRRVNEEFQRARRYKLSLTILAFEIVDFHSFTENVQKDVLIVINTVFRNILRSIDLLFHGDDLSTCFILLPNTSYIGAQIVKQKFLQEIYLFNIKPYHNSKEALYVHAVEEEINHTMKNGDELVEKTFEKMVIDHKTGIYRYSHLIKRLNEEINILRTNDHACLSALILEIEYVHLFSKQMNQDILTVIKIVTQNKINETVQIFHDQDPARIIILLPNVSIADSRITMDHIYNEMMVFNSFPDDNANEFLINMAAVEINDDIDSPQKLVQKAGQEMIVNGNTGIFTYRYFKKKLHNLKKMHTLKTPLIGISIIIDSFHQFSPDIKKDIMNIIQMIRQNKLEYANHLFHDKNPSKFILVLPNTSISQAKVTRTIFSQEVNAFNLTPLHYKALKIKFQLIKIKI